MFPYGSMQKIGYNESMKAGRFALVVQRKLKSRQGASLSIALLIFLLCATVGSVVLAAANTSYGTLVGKNQSDQKKYALISAAETFRDTAETIIINVPVDSETEPDVSDSMLKEVIYSTAIKKEAGSAEVTMEVKDPNVHVQKAMASISADPKQPAGSYIVTISLLDDVKPDEEAGTAVHHMIATTHTDTATVKGTVQSVASYSYNCDGIEVQHAKNSK